MPTNSSLFMKVHDSNIVIVLVYVNDLIIVGDDRKDIDQIRNNLSVHF